MNGKSPSSNMERNLVFVYYLKQISQIPQITMDHVYTCYRRLGIKLPKALDQSLRDTATDTRWITLTTLDSIELTNAGINKVEHELTNKKRPG